VALTRDRAHAPAGPSSRSKPGSGSRLERQKSRVVG
jgi:hypothetical protein